MASPSSTSTEAPPSHAGPHYDNPTSKPLEGPGLKLERERTQRLLWPIEWAVPIPDAVSCAVITVKLVDLAVLFERSLVLVHLFGARRAIVVAEYPNERAG